MRSPLSKFISPVFPTRKYMDTRQQNIAIELHSTIASKIDFFTGRSWLLPNLLEWLERRNNSLHILSGKPGTGKSMISAWLAGRGPVPASVEAKVQLEKFRSHFGAVHFCVAASGTTDPRNLSKNVAEQLTRNIKGFSDALIKTLPEQIQISVKQTFGTATDSSVTGVYIESLNMGALGDEASFNRLVREPLKQLYKDGYNEPLILIIDSLDEAETYTGEFKIVQILTKLDDLPKPIKFLVTTRPDPRILKNFQGIQPFDLVENEPLEAKDICLYAYERLTQIEEAQRTQLANRISHSAEGIFLYANLVLNDLEPLLSKDLNLENIDLPNGLAGIYQTFLNRELGQDEERWYDLFQPLLGAIAVAQGDGLPLKQLERIVERDSLVMELRICAQYLIGMPNGPFRVFHKSFVDFLLEDKDNTHYHIDSIEQHQRIVKYYRPNHTLWNWNQTNLNELDDYGLRYLATHLAKITKISNSSLQHQYTKSLVELIANPDFQRIHQAKLQDLAALQHDVEQALRTVSVDPDPLAVPLVIEMALASISFRKIWLSPEPIFELAWKGNIEAAEQRLNLFTMEPEWYQVAVLMIAWLAAQQNPDKAKQLRDRVASNLLKEEPLPTLLKRLDACLEDKPVLDLLPLPDVTASNVIEAILMRMGGVEDDELLIGAGINPLFSPSLLVETDDELPFYVSEQDGPLLVSYAVAHPQEGEQYLQQYIEIHSAYAYREYRNRSLMVLLKAILNHPEQEWVLQTLPKIVAAAATGANYEFRDGLSLTLLRLQAASGNLAATKQLETYIQPIQQAIAQFRDSALNSDPYQEE